MKPTQLYKINSMFARANKLPVLFAATPLLETTKAIFLFGKGTTESARFGYCCICGRTLTHPVSVELGIGPECGHHYWDWDKVGGYTKENIARLTQTIHENIKINQWMPKSVIQEVHDTSDIVTPPSDHPMLKSRENTVKSRSCSMVVYQQNGNEAIKIMFPYNLDDLNRVKTLSGRKFHSEGANKYWSAPLCIETVEKLQEWGFEMSDGLIDYVQTSHINVEDMEEMEVTGIGMELYPFQKKGVAFIEAQRGRAIVADEMGLGKTAQALSWLQLHPEKRPAVVVVPASLKLNWERECQLWMNKPKVQILSGTSTNVPLIGEIIIINYDILPNWVPALLLTKPQVLIADECHYFKNNSALRTKAIKMLGKRIPHILALSGTPIINRPVEIYNAVKLVDRTLFPNFMDFARRYCNAKHNGFGWDFNGSSNTEELHEKLTNSIMIRRKKEDVLTDLPAKTYSFVPIELTNRQEYRQVEQDFINWVKETKGINAAIKASQAETLTRIEALKQKAVEGKMKQAIDWITNHLEVNGKLVVFAVHKFVIDQLMEVFKSVAVKIDGSTSMADRQKAVDEFQTNDRIRLFVGNVKAAGVGLTLTASSNVAFLEFPWAPGELDQASDRCHRIGQKDNVTVYYLMAEGTIEDDIASMLDSKRKILNQVLDGHDAQQETLLNELINKYYNL